MKDIKEQSKSELQVKIERLSGTMRSQLMTFGMQVDTLKEMVAQLNKSKKPTTWERKIEEVGKMINEVLKLIR